jgi:hypothetical protein
MLSAEATNTNFIVFGLTQPWLEPTIYHTQGEHANHYTTDVVFLVQADSKSKDWLAQNQNNVSEWSDMLFQ